MPHTTKRKKSAAVLTWRPPIFPHPARARFFLNKHMFAFRIKSRQVFVSIQGFVFVFKTKHFFFWEVCFARKAHTRKNMLGKESRRNRYNSNDIFFLIFFFLGTLLKLASLGDKFFFSFFSSISQSYFNLSSFLAVFSPIYLCFSFSLLRLLCFSLFKRERCVIICWTWKSESERRGVAFLCVFF